MLRIAGIVTSALCAAVLVFSIATATESAQFHGNWQSELNYDGVNYTLVLALAPAEDGNITGKLRVLDDGYEVESLGFKSVEMKGDSLVIQTNSVDGRAAKFALTNAEKQLSGLFWEVSYSGQTQGEGMKMVFKPVEE